MSEAPSSAVSENIVPIHRIREWKNEVLKGIFLAALGALLGFYKDEIHAFVYKYLTQGAIGGDYILTTLEFRHEEPYEWTRFEANVSLKQGGTRVFGDQVFSPLSEPRSWRVFGFYRDPFLALSYENKESAAIGAGTFSLQRELPYVFVGYWSGVECKGKKRAWSECPCILVRADHKEQAKKEEDFLKTPCRWLAEQGESCSADGKLEIPPQLTGGTFIVLPSSRPKRPYRAR